MPDGNGTRKEPRTVRTFARVFAVVANLVLLDAVTKEWAAAKLKGAASRPVVPGFFDLAYVENRGCAWGLFQHHVWPLALAGIAALVFLVWKRREIFHVDASGWRRRCGAACECILYAGIAGNLIDRVFRGYVIDFLDFHWGGAHFPCFNVADVCISVAAMLLILLSLTAGRAVRKA